MACRILADVEILPHSFNGERRKNAEPAPDIEDGYRRAEELRALLGRFLRNPDDADAYRAMREAAADGDEMRADDLIDLLIEAGLIPTVPRNPGGRGEA